MAVMLRVHGQKQTLASISCCSGGWIGAVKENGPVKQELTPFETHTKQDWPVTQSIIIGVMYASGHSGWNSAATNEDVEMTEC